MVPVLRTLQTEQDLLSIWQYVAIDQQKPQAADQLLRAIDETITTIASQPMIGESYSRLRKGLRVFPHGNFLIFYEQMRDGIMILRVLHGARDWETLIRE